MERIRARNIDKDEDAQIMGIPLYILIIVIIATISLAAIMGFMVTRDAGIERVEIEQVKIDGELNEDVVCDDIRNEGEYKEGYAYYKGSERPDKEDGESTLDPVEGYDENLVVTVFDEDDNKMADVKVKATGAGIDEVGTTNNSGQLEIPLDGVSLPPGVDNDEIKIEAESEGFVGPETATTTIWVVRGD